MYIELMLLINAAFKDCWRSSGFSFLSSFEVCPSSLELFKLVILFLGMLQEWNNNANPKELLIASTPEVQRDCPDMLGRET